MRCMLGEADVATARQRSEPGQFDVLPSNRELAGAEVEMVSLDNRERRLKDALALVDKEYDFILIDCPPALSMLTLNGLCAAHGVIIPDAVRVLRAGRAVRPGQHHQEGARQPEPDLKIIGLLRVMFDPRMTLSQQVSAQLEQHFGDKVFKTIIPRNVRLAEAPSYGLPGVTFDPTSKGAQAYIAFGAEMVKRIKKM
jgi:chromosome partitioning protein